MPAVITEPVRVIFNLVPIGTVATIQVGIKLVWKVVYGRTVLENNGQKIYIKTGT